VQASEKDRMIESLKFPKYGVNPNNDAGLGDHLKEGLSDFVNKN